MTVGRRWLPMTNELNQDGEMSAEVLKVKSKQEETSAALHVKWE